MSAPRRRRGHRPVVPYRPIELVDDGEIALRVGSGELVPLAGETPVDSLAVDRLRNEMERRRLGERYHEPKKPNGGAR